MRFSLRKYIVPLLFAAVILSGKNTLDIKYLSDSPEKNIPDSIKVLAIMVEFQDDDLSQTTGNGKFNSGYPDTLLIDGTPHDRAYFEDQLTFVKNYFESQSGGRAVFPSLNVLDTVLTLHKPMWYYNPNNGDEVLLERLLELYRDSWEQVKNDSTIDFKSYNTFVVYHAGSGQEFSPGYDETPFDIPSVYLSSKDLETLKLTAWDGTEINNTVILPECEWQTLEDDWYHAGMGGISCLMFAHRLGIPNLYSSSDGRSGIGKFGLMDQGSANFSGLIPSGISAWVKEYKGWVNVNVISTPQSDVAINAGSDILRIDINSDEYFLLENRTPVNYTSDRTELLGYDRDSLMIRFFYDEDGFETYEIEEGFKTLVSIEDSDYDFGLPAGFGVDDVNSGEFIERYKGGILIWHIDRKKTTAFNIENNLINDDFKDKGIYLEEADGSFDIGKDYWILDNGYGTELGWFYDAFSADNSYWQKYPNFSLVKIEFSSRSYPISDTNDGIATGIKLNEFSRIGRQMTFSFSYEKDDVYYSVDPGLGASVYLSAYAEDGTVRHYFAGSDGNYKIYFRNEDQKDSLLFEDVYTDSVNTDFFPVQYADMVMTVAKDRQGLFLTDISTGTPSELIAPGTIVSQPVNGVFALDTGIYELNSGMTGFDPVSNLFTDADQLKVLREETGELIFLAGTDNANTVFSIDLTTDPYTVSETDTTSDLFYHYSIITDADRSEYSLFTHAVTTDSGEEFLGTYDVDSDGKPEIISASESRLSVKSENGVFENGFPAVTNLGHIEKGFIFGDEEKFIAAADSSSNYALISGSGDYDLSSYRTINSFSENSGLLKIGTGVYLYSHNTFGILSYHRIGTGSINGYLESLNGVVILSDGTPAGSGIVSKSVYNWPNPARGNETNFRFFLNEPCRVDIDIYDINGNRIKKLSQDYMTAGDYAELVWDVSNVPSGVYNAILSFRSGSGSEKRLVRAAVVK
jgi:M6 family metalloprotease-like protein